MIGSTRPAGNALVDEYDPNSPAALLCARLTDPFGLVGALGIRDVTRRSKSYLGMPCPRGCGGIFCTLGWVKKKGLILWYCPTCRQGGNALHVIAFARGLHIVHDFPKVLHVAERIAIAMERKAQKEVLATTS